MAQRFYPIKLKEIRKTTKDCSVLTFDISDSLKEAFSYKHGQHLTLKTNINGEEVRRSYSLCSSPLDHVWQVAVKKIDDGRFSTYVNDVLKVGDELEIMPPNGKFYKEIDKTKTKNYVAFAAGSGITPIHSIIKTHLTEEPNSRFKLFYFNQTIQSIILKEEVEGLKNKFLNRFELYHFLTKEKRDAPLFNGRMSVEKMDSISNLLLDIHSVDEYFLCGPIEMVFLIRDYIQEHGVAKEKIHFELFGTPKGAKKKKSIDVNNADMSDISIINNGVRTSFLMSQSGVSILDAALSNNADLPFACKGGVCCTCKAKLIEGEIEMEVNYALEKEEVEQGYILTCQSVPKTKNIVVDFDC
ncbi:MAG: phenylacetate-CoA oxygenase/reductase subunit PaaK [Bacteroidetes bacterium]|nr:MAG: phenylacetate-CoA oxygenase/reductase subunit PaaK [Bacteroidota bacterium]MBL1145670.1 phenylacetate-CoA oxygenase/reductase subunit PaaK [Bacteroidota bacterium]NOG58464.1 phenylacetate-CoA oxygenase/reductase subunit PaaK [Bacteroidota bacterium]